MVVVLFRILDEYNFRIYLEMELRAILPDDIERNVLANQIPTFPMKKSPIINPIYQFVLQCTNCLVPVLIPKMTILSILMDFMRLADV